MKGIKVISLYLKTATASVSPNTSQLGISAISQPVCGASV